MPALESREPKTGGCASTSPLCSCCRPPRMETYGSSPRTPRGSSPRCPELPFYQGSDGGVLFVRGRRVGFAKQLTCSVLCFHALGSRTPLNAPSTTSHRLL